MAKNSRAKGKAGELELSKALQALGFLKARRGLQARGGWEASDIIGLPGLHIECKRKETFSVYPALDQAKGDALGTHKIPVVAHRKNHKPWVVVVELDNLLEFCQRVLDGVEKDEG